MPGGTGDSGAIDTGARSEKLHPDEHYLPLEGERLAAEAALERVRERSKP
jgi:hypothetical protein